MGRMHTWLTLSHTASLGRKLVSRPTSEDRNRQKLGYGMSSFVIGAL